MKNDGSMFKGRPLGVYGIQYHYKLQRLKVHEIFPKSTKSYLPSLASNSERIMEKSRNLQIGRSLCGDDQHDIKS